MLVVACLNCWFVEKKVMWLVAKERFLCTVFFSELTAVKILVVRVFRAGVFSLKDMHRAYSLDTD